MYKIDRRGGRVQKSFTRTDPTLFYDSSPPPINFVYDHSSFMYIIDMRGVQKSFSIKYLDPSPFNKHVHDFLILGLFLNRFNLVKVGHVATVPCPGLSCQSQCSAPLVCHNPIAWPIICLHLFLK